MHWSRLVGLVLLAVGIILLIMGWNASESLTEELHETVTGRFTEDTRMLFIGGGAAAIAGVAMLVFGVRR